jgi:flagellar basal body rod protein FlgG
MLMNTSSSFQALKGLSVSQAVTANNLANAGTNGFKASRVTFETGPGGEGVHVQEVRRNRRDGRHGAEEQGIERGDAFPEQTAATVDSSNTDPSREVVQMILDNRMFEANAITARAIETTSGRILDLLI